MDTPSGLVVPNIKSVQTKSILEIALELTRLQELGTKSQLGPGDLNNGTFSLSSIGNVSRMSDE
jgi:2-oxoisovalerate dehydrogenase E2 component (dihydrolipoyl transacylase)